MTVCLRRRRGRMKRRFRPIVRITNVIKLLAGWANDATEYIEEVGKR